MKGEPTWGYKPDGAAQIFEDGELPEGWSTDIAVIADPARRTADALSNVTPVVEANVTEDPEADKSAPALAAAIARIAELEGVIAGGQVENERLGKDLADADEDLEHAATDLAAVKAERDAAIAERDEARAALEVAGREAKDALDALGAELTKAQADGGFALEELAKAQASIADLSAQLDAARAKPAGRK